MSEYIGDEIGYKIELGIELSLRGEVVLYSLIQELRDLRTSKDVDTRLFIYKKFSIRSVSAKIHHS